MKFTSVQDEIHKGLKEKAKPHRKTLLLLLATSTHNKLERKV